MNVLPDPITDALDLFFKHGAVKLLTQRLTLLMEMYLIAAPIAFLTACGGSLVTLVDPRTHPVVFSIGTGMVLTAVALLATFKASKNSADLIISVPAETTEKQLETPMSTIERAK